MVEFKHRIVQFGFGAVGKSFFEKVSNEIQFDNNEYYVISRDQTEYATFLEMGGKLGNFIEANVTKNNYQKLFEKYLHEGDFLIDFADSVGTKDFMKWCALHNVMYLNTGETDWEDNWYSIFEENTKKIALREELKHMKDVNKVPIVLQHGNNPGLVSHFVKAGIEYIVTKQFSKDKHLHQLLQNKQFNLLAEELEISEIHVNDNDEQVVKEKFNPRILYSTWSVDSFFFEMISKATAVLGTEEKSFTLKEASVDQKNGYLEFSKIALDIIANTYYPRGKMKGYMVPHEETITIAKSLEVKNENDILYRPTVVFLYSPCEHAIQFLKKARKEKIEETPTSMNDTVIKGFEYPTISEIIYKENIKRGTEYVGVLILGKRFHPVWVGNRIKKHFLYRHLKTSYWQTPTITPVSMSALAACCWMIEHQEQGGIYFPDEIMDYHEMITFAEKYISKTIYQTIPKKKLEQKLHIDLNHVQLKDIIELER